uniref:BTB domain-containing protein n=1 Tax=Caenorhabditis tropicalis TaxID=1561998 RepID=A0A1I7TGP3_9PELO
MSDENAAAQMNNETNGIKTESQKVQPESVNELVKEMKTMKEHQETILEEIRSIRGEMKENRTVSSVADRIESTSTSFETLPQKLRNRFLLKKILFQNELPSIPMKHFVLKHTFKNDTEETSFQRIRVSHQENHLTCYAICCELFPTDNSKLIDTKLKIKIGKRDGGSKSFETRIDFGRLSAYGQLVAGCGWNELIEWEQLKKEYLVDDILTVECHLEINKYDGIYKDNLREFDETMEEFSDVVLVVKDQKFFFLSKFLAVQSSYFKAMFLGHFNESSQFEIKLSGIDADDFQNYLEVLYGELAIDEYTVEGILMVSDMYDTQSVIRKCEEFLLKESKKTLKNKLEMAVRYNLEKLRKKCLSEVTTVGSIRTVIPGDLRDLDPSLMADLFEKSLSFQW